MTQQAESVKVSILHRGIDFRSVDAGGVPFGTRECAEPLWTDYNGAQPDDSDKAGAIADAIRFLNDPAYGIDGRIFKPELEVVRTQKIPRRMQLLRWSIPLGALRVEEVLETIPLSQRH